MYSTNDKRSKWYEWTLFFVLCAFPYVTGVVFGVWTDSFEVGFFAFALSYVSIILIGLGIGVMFCL